MKFVKNIHYWGFNVHRLVYFNQWSFFLLVVIPLYLEKSVISHYLPYPMHCVLTTKSITADDAKSLMSNQVILPHMQYIVEVNY